MDEPAVAPSQSLRSSKLKRKGKILAHKFRRRKTVVVSLPAATAISRETSLQMESSLKGLADIPIPDGLGFQDFGLEGLHFPSQTDAGLGALDVWESTLASKATTMGWLGGLHMHTHISPYHTTFNHMFSSFRR